jgi:hypothetical protein
MTLRLFRGISQRHLFSALALLAAASSAACVKRLPPAPIPQALVPRLDDVPPPPGDSGRLVVDVVEGAVPVSRVRMLTEQTDNGQGRVSYRLIETPELLCATTPCAANVPRGNVLIGFPVIGNPGALEVEILNIGPEPTVYRRSLSVYQNRTGALRVLGIIGTSLGGASVVTGTVFLPVGLSKDNDGLTRAGAITLGGGAVLVALGIWAILRDTPTIRPGSSNHFLLSPSAPPGSR